MATNRVSEPERSLMTFFLSNGLVVSGFLSDEQWDEVLPELRSGNGSLAGEKIPPRLADAVRRAATGAWSIHQYATLVDFHQQGGP